MPSLNLRSAHHYFEKYTPEGFLKTFLPGDLENNDDVDEAAKYYGGLQILNCQFH